MTKKIILGVIAAIVLVLAGVGIGSVIFRTSVRSGDFSTFTNGLYVLSGGFREGGISATSTTATSYTMATSDISNFQTIVLTPNTGTLTLTLPNFSVLSSLVPNVGDYFGLTLVNGTTTAGQNITFVKTQSAGVNVIDASTTLNVVPQAQMFIDITRSTTGTTTVFLTPAA